MSYDHDVPLASRATRLTAVAAVICFSAALVSALVPARWTGDSTPSPSAVAQEPSPAPVFDQPGRAPRDGDEGGFGVAGGGLPAGVAVFDDAYPAVANLDPSLLSALREAASDANRDGVAFVVNSGWRSAEYQERLLDQAVAVYGTRQEAARWVATPTTSAHVAGDAVDIGPSDAQAWLRRNGAEYGLCQTYDNEPWHFERRSQAVGGECPAPYPDPTHDPRMQP